MKRTWRQFGARLGVALLAGLGANRAHAEDPPLAKERLTCRHWAVLLPEDAGQTRVYDGVRKGLELAQLERVCLKDVADDEAAFTSFVAWHKTLPEPAPLVFAIGRLAGARLHAARYAGPGVLASTEMTAEGRLLASEPTLGPRTARVRAEVTAEAWGTSLRDLLGLPADAKPVVQFGWRVWDVLGGLSDAVRRFATAARVEVAGPTLVGSVMVPPHKLPPTSDRPVQAVLHLRLGAGEVVEPFADALAQAQELRVPLLSDDPARFGAGATLLVVPDYQRLGRMAAEAGRRLWRDEPNALEPLVVKSTEVWVDLVAAEAIGLEPPLTFLAAADRVRAPPPKRAAAPAPGAPR